LLRSEPQPLPETTGVFEPDGQATRAVAPVPTAQPLAAPTSAVIAQTATLPTPTALSIPTLAVETEGVRSLMDVSFAARPANNWLDNPPFAAWSDGAYRFQARDETRFVAAGVPINQILTDVVVGATFRKTGGPPGGGYGLILRDQGPEPRDGANQEMTAYVFETGDLGEYGVWRRDGDHWVDLQAWTPSNSVRSGGSPNDLSVRASGDTFTFTINGTAVATIQDDKLDAGGVGLFVGGDHNEVALDHFSVQLLD
jgi:hypothetical protein